MDKEGELMGYGTVYYHPKVAANVISFFNLTKKFDSVVYDNQKKDAFIVTRKDGSQLEFVPSKEGLYYYDFLNSVKRRKELIPIEIAETREERTMLIQTMEEIKRNFTRRELDAVEEARRLYVIVGRPSKKTFEDMLQRGWIMNNPVTITDFRNALMIYGEDLGVLKGKTVRKKTSHVKVETETRNEMKTKEIILSVDLMYVLGLTFLVTVSRDIRFITASVLLDRKKNTIMNAIKQVMKIYQGKGHEIESVEFNVQNNPVHTILVDNEFQTLKDELEMEGVVQVNIIGKDEHVPEAERQNRVIKEQIRAIIQTLP